MQMLPAFTPVTARYQSGLRHGLASKWAKAPGHAADNPIPTLDAGNACNRMLQCF